VLVQHLKISENIVVLPSLVRSVIFQLRQKSKSQAVNSDNQIWNQKTEHTDEYKQLSNYVYFAIS
jgi:hypothetical protein